MVIVILNWLSGDFAHLSRECVYSGVLGEEGGEARAEETKADTFYYVKW